MLRYIFLPALEILRLSSKSPNFPFCHEYNLRVLMKLDEIKIIGFQLRGVQLHEHEYLDYVIMMMVLEFVIIFWHPSYLC